MVRDGYTCVITGYEDVSHPARNESDPDMFLQASHILRRSIGNFDKDHTSVICPFEASHIAYQLSFTFYIQFKSAVTTFDILRNFTRIPVENLEDLHSHLDDPSNGMMLDFYAHTLFDNFKWCLNKAEVRVPSIVIISLTTHPDRRCVHSETLQCSSIAHA